MRKLFTQFDTSLLPLVDSDSLSAMVCLTIAPHTARRPDNMGNFTHTSNHGSPTVSDDIVWVSLLSIGRLLGLCWRHSMLRSTYMQQTPMTDACNLRFGEMLACVGAGGKTTTCWRLWREIQTGRQPAIFSTTTHIWEPALPPNTALLLSNNPDVAVMRHLFTNNTGLVLAASRLGKSSIAVPHSNPVAPVIARKLVGLSLDQIDQLFCDLTNVTWLIEADGARGRGLKIPDTHEPQIPTSASVVVVTVSLDIIDHALDERSVHRAEQVAAYLQTDSGAHITAQHIARVLTDPHAALKGIPAAARVIALLNQINSEKAHPHAASIARQVMASNHYERVIVASLRAEEPILEVFTT